MEENTRKKTVSAINKEISVCSLCLCIQKITVLTVSTVLQMTMPVSLDFTWSEGNGIKGLFILVLYFFVKNLNFISINRIILQSTW